MRNLQMLAEVANVQTVYAKKEGGKSEKIQKTHRKNTKEKGYKKTPSRMFVCPPRRDVG